MKALSRFNKIREQALGLAHKKGSFIVRPLLAMRVFERLILWPQQEANGLTDSRSHLLNFMAPSNNTWKL